MGLELRDLDRIVSLTEPAIHPLEPRGVVVHKTVNADGTGYTSRLYAVGSDGVNHFLTSGPKDSHPAFSSDGLTLWFVRGSDAKGQQLMRMPWHGGEAVSVGPVFWDLARVVPIPGTEDVLVLARAPEEPPEETHWPRHYDRWQWQYDGQSYFPDKPLSLWLVKVGQDPVRLDGSPYDVASVAVSPDGRFAVYDRVADEESARVPRQDIFRVSLESPFTTDVLTSGPNNWRSPAVLADGRVVALGSGQEFGPAAIESLYDIAPATVRLPLPEDLEVGEAISSDARFGASAIGPAPAGLHGVTVAATEQGRTRLWMVSPESAEPLPIDLGVIAQYAVRGHGAPVALITGGSLDQLDEAYWFEEDLLKPLTQFNAWARSLLSPIERIIIDRPEGWRIPAYIIGREEGRPKPLILYVHGGPHGAYGETPRYDSQVMAQQGYIVAQVNPRGSMGYGQAFRNAVRGDWGGEDMKDLMAVVDHLVDTQAADPNNLYVTGGSYGGFMTSWIVGHTDRFRAASTAVPVTNLISFYGTSDIGWWFGPGEVGPTPFENLEELWKASPLAYAERVTTPTQVVAGEDDRRCPIEQAEQYYTALKHFGVPTEFLRYPGPHSFSTQGRPELRRDRLERLFNWFERFRQP